MPEDVPPEICRDLDDLAVLGTASAARADLLITVDRDLLPLLAALVLATGTVVPAATLVRHLLGVLAGVRAMTIDP